MPEERQIKASFFFTFSNQMPYYLAFDLLLDEIAGKLSVKHIYEIAKVKSKDKCLVGVPLQVSFSSSYLFDLCLCIFFFGRLELIRTHQSNCLSGT